MTDPEIQELPLAAGKTPDSPLYWTGVRRPFLYHWPTNKIYLGQMGTHHGHIYEQLGSGVGKEFPYREYNEGMIFTKNIPDMGGRYDPVSWWSPPDSMATRQSIENFMRRSYPEINWEGQPVSGTELDEDDWSDEPSHTLGSHTLGGAWDDVDREDAEWEERNALEQGQDFVKYIPGLFHKGIMTHDGDLHMWPLNEMHDDAHPYHAEYSTETGIPYQDVPKQWGQPEQRNPGGTDTRFYVAPDGGYQDYSWDGNDPSTWQPSFFSRHHPDEMMERLMPHVPGVYYGWNWEPGDEDDWTTSHTLPHALGALGDEVEYDPKWDTHKGILTGDDYLHIWPVGYQDEDEGWVADDDGHPYHEEYSQSRGVEERPSTDTRFYLQKYPEGKPQLITYYDQVGDPGYYNAHGTDELLNRVQEHVPNAYFTGKPYVPESDEEYSWSTSPLDSHTLGSAMPYPTGEVHIALDVPERIRLQIARWVESLALPRESLTDPLTYHITVVYSPEGVEYLVPHEIQNNFNLTGLKFVGKALSKFQDSLVVELENPYFVEWAEKLADYLEERGIDPARYPGGPKPHITIAEGVSKSAPLPPISFRCGGLSISTPRSASQIALGPYTAGHTLGASPPATPPPWQPGTWGKGLFFDGPNGSQMSAWTTGTKSMVGGTPHHNQVAEGHHGIEWGDMIDMMRGEHPSGTRCYLLQVQPDGIAYDHAMGKPLPASFNAVAAEHGIQRHPKDVPLELETDYDWN